jgi:D-amino peptidase
VTDTLRVLISADLEGVAGVATRQQSSPTGGGYDAACRLMTAEVNAAVHGAYEGGATVVVVNDSHARMDNLLSEQLDDRVTFVVGSPKRLSMMEQVETGCDVALFVGYHAGPSSADGVLPHTYSGSAFSDVRLNGESVGELELNALIAAQYGVPVGLVTGDEQVCARAAAVLPDVVTVAVKRGLGATAAVSMTPAAAVRAIQDGARQAVERVHRLAPVVVPDRLSVEAELRPNGAADLARLVPGTERVSARVVRRTVADPRELQDVLLCWEALVTAYVHG